MDRFRLAALVALLGGLGLLLAGALQGDVRVILLVVLPVIVAEGPLPSLGMLLLVAAGVLWFVASLRRISREPPPALSHEEWGERPRPASRSGGIVLLGPIPIVWGSDRRTLGWMVAAGAVLLVLGLLWLSWGRR